MVTNKILRLLISDGPSQVYGNYSDLRIKMNTMLVKSFKTCLHGTFTLVHSTMNIQKSHYDMRFKSQ